jgi:hypothetical protein
VLSTIVSQRCVCLVEDLLHICDEPNLFQFITHQASTLSLALYLQLRSTIVSSHYLHTLRAINHLPTFSKMRFHIITAVVFMFTSACDGQAILDILPDNSYHAIEHGRETALTLSPTSHIKGRTFDRFVQIWLENEEDNVTPNDRKAFNPKVTYFTNPSQRTSSGLRLVE